LISTPAFIPQLLTIARLFQFTKPLFKKAENQQNLKGTPFDFMYFFTFFLIPRCVFEKKNTILQKMLILGQETEKHAFFVFFWEISF